MSTALNRSFPAEPRLTRSQRESLRGALSSARKAIFFTPAQRQVVRDICHAAGDWKEKPEQCLVAFKAGLFEAANDLKMPAGAERTVLLERFVSLFIEEMYRAEPANPKEDGDNRWRTVSGIIPAGNREPPGAHL
jgi:hypothetical protein